MITEPFKDIVSGGVDPKRKMLFVIDGSNALKAAINAVFGAQQPVQRPQAAQCRVPTDGSLSVGWNVLDYLPRDQQLRPSACCARPGSWDRKRAWRASRSWPHGWTHNIPRQRQA